MRRLIPFITLTLMLAACASPGPPEIIDLPTVAVLPPTPTLAPTLTPSITVTPSITPTPSATPTGTLPPTATVTVTPSATITDTVTPTPSDTMTPTETLPALEGLSGLGFLAARTTVIPDFVTPGTPPVRSREEVLNVVTARPRGVAVTATPLGGVPGAAIPTFGAPASGGTPTPLGGPVVVDDCPNPAPGGFGTAVANNPLIAVTLGCPVSSPETRTSAYQPYQNGFMVWVSNPNGAGNIYTFDNTNGTVQVFADTWQSGVDPERGGDTPPDGLIEPIRGFGKVWREQPGVRDALGWATNAEQGAEASVLLFESGQLLALRQTNQIIAVANDGTWSATSGTP